MIGFLMIKTSPIAVLTSDEYFWVSTSTYYRTPLLAASKIRSFWFSMILSSSEIMNVAIFFIAFIDQMRLAAGLDFADVSGS